MFLWQCAESTLTSLKHYSRHELLNTQYIYIIFHIKLLAESETIVSLKVQCVGFRGIHWQEENIIFIKIMFPLL